MEGYGYFISEIFSRLTNQYPQHEFIFLFDRPYHESFVFATNVIPVVVTPKARHALSFRWWYDVKVPLALKKYKADVFVSPDGFCSLTTKVPQVLVVHDLAFLHYPQFIPKPHLFYYKRYTPRYLRKANIVATVSEFSKHDIIKQYNTKSEKVINVSSAARDIFQPIEWHEKELMKDKYADGCEYFVFVGGIHPRKNLLNLLKAFSLFKVRQHTSIKLVIIGRMAWHYKDMLEKLETYKFRKEIKLTGYLKETEVVKVVAGAYALIFPSFFEGFGVPPLEAMKCRVPVIAANTSSLPEVCGDAALYANPADPADIAEQLKMIFKSEQLRGELQSKGDEQVKKFSWNNSASLMWSAIEAAVSK